MLTFLTLCRVVLRVVFWLPSFSFGDNSVFHMLELAVDPEQDQGDTLLEQPDDEGVLYGLRESLYGSKHVWNYNQTQQMADGNINVQAYVDEIRTATEAEDATQEHSGRTSGLAPSISPLGATTRAKRRTRQLVGGDSRRLPHNHQLNEQEKAIEMNISMRLEAEAAEEEKAIDACTSPLQVSTSYESFRTRYHCPCKNVTLYPVPCGCIPTFQSGPRACISLQASGLLSSLMASAVTTAEDANQALDFEHLNVANDYDPEALANGVLLARPPSSSPPKTADGRPVSRRTFHRPDLAESDAN